MLGSGKQWVGAVGAVRVKHEEYNGSQQAKVAYCIARSRQDKLAPWNSNTTTAPAMDASSLKASFGNLPFDM